MPLVTHVGLWGEPACKFHIGCLAIRFGSWRFRALVSEGSRGGSGPCPTLLMQQVDMYGGHGELGLFAVYTNVMEAGPAGRTQTAAYKLWTGCHEGKEMC